MIIGVGYERDGHDRLLEGLNLDLAPGGYHVFEMSMSLKWQRESVTEE